MITGQKVSLAYKSKKSTTQVLKNVSFKLCEGRITTFMGQSGAGKTSLLKCIANLNSHYEGSIIYGNSDLKSLCPATRASTIGFVLQQFHLFPHMTVLQNCIYALKAALKVEHSEAEQRSVQILEALHMMPFAYALPAQLSGGQQQRAAIARALVLNPKVLLLDEPTSALDPDSKRSLEDLLKELNSRGMTIALSSHDMPFIRKIMDHVYFIEQGELIETLDCTIEKLSSKPKTNQFLSHI